MVVQTAGDMAGYEGVRAGTGTGAFWRVGLVVRRIIGIREVGCGTEGSGSSCGIEVVCYGGKIGGM